MANITVNIKQKKCFLMFQIIYKCMQLRLHVSNLFVALKLKYYKIKVNYILKLNEDSILSFSRFE